MKKKRKTRLTPEFWKRDAELKRAVAERLAYYQLLEEERGSWKDELDPEMRRRVEERAEQILAQTRGTVEESTG